MSPQEYQDHLYRYLSAAQIWPGLHALVPEPEPIGIDPAQAQAIKASLVYDMSRSSDTPPPQAKPAPDSGLEQFRLLIGSWFKRRPSTKWSDKEMKALKLVYKGLDQSDMAIISQYYTAPIPTHSDFRRRDVVTLLNNWTGEVDRARRWAGEQQAPVQPKPSSEPLWKQVKTLEQVLASHPANPNSMGYRADHSPAQRQDYLSKWQDLQRLKQTANV